MHSPARPPYRLGRRRLLGLAGALVTSALGACSQPETSSTPGAKVLVAYFSRAGENYSYGDRTWLKVGNTEVVARMIADVISCDLHRIEAAEPYPDGYDQTVARASPSEANKPAVRDLR